MRAWKDKKYILPSLLGRGWGVGLLLLLLLTACHDDDGPDMIGPEAAAWTVDVLGGGAVETDDEGNVYFERTATFGSLRLKIQGYDARRDSTVKVALAEGGSKDGPLWGNEDSKEYFGTDRLRNIITQMSGTAAANSSLFTLHSSLNNSSLFTLHSSLNNSSLFTLHLRSTAV